MGGLAFFAVSEGRSRLGARGRRLEAHDLGLGLVDLVKLLLLRLLALLGLPLVAVLVVFSVWIIGVSAIATALPIALASAVATPLWGVACLYGRAAEAEGEAIG